MEQVLVCTGSQSEQMEIFVGWLLMFVCRFVESGVEYYDCLLNGLALLVPTRFGEFFRYLFLSTCLLCSLISNDHRITAQESDNY